MPDIHAVAVTGITPEGRDHSVLVEWPLAHIDLEPIVPYVAAIGRAAEDAG